MRHGLILNFICSHVAKEIVRIELWFNFYKAAKYPSNCEQKKLKSAPVW